MSANDKIIELEKDSDGTYKPTNKISNHTRMAKNSPIMEQKSVRKNPLDIIIQAALGQLEKETKRMIKGLFR
jgi:hypothetical protein